MYLWYLRLNTLFFFALTYLIITSALSSLTVLYHSPNIRQQIDNHNILLFRSFHNDYLSLDIDEVYIDIDYQIDLRPIWNWNVKQIFLYLSAEYIDNKTDKISEIVLWDKIIQSSSDSDLYSVNERMKYVLRDFYKDLRNKDIKLTFHYDLMPYIGLVKNQRISKPIYIFNLGQEYVTI